jgi:hypothetical protein
LKTKLLSVFLLFFIVLSNISFGLTGIFSFISEKDNYAFSNAVNIQEQYNMLVSIPKDFLDMCVKIQNDFKILKTNKEVNLFFNKSLCCLNNNMPAVLTSPLKLRISYLYNKSDTIEKAKEYSNNIFMLFSLILVFYILRYVGLLKLFSSYDYTNKIYKGFYYSV